MSLFHHPHLTRGVVKTPKGSFVIVRGIVEAPDEIGESLGWHPVEPASAAPPVSSGPSSPAQTPAASEPAVSRPSSKTAQREARARMIRAKAAKLRSRLHM